MMSSRVILLLGGLLLAGCASDWSHPTASVAQYESDDAECKRIARRESQHQHPSLRRLDYGKAYEACMYKRGYRGYY